MKPSSIYICKLIKTFPCLRDRVCTDPAVWDEKGTDALSPELGVLSSGERHAALFILNVWNPGYAEDQGWNFNLMDALGCWGSDNRAAFVAWCQKPYWP